MTALTDADQDAGLRREPTLHTFHINPVGGTNIRAEGTNRFATEAEVLAYADWARATIATLRARATAAEAERDEETARRHKHQRDWSESFRQLSEAWQHEIRENDANLIALAKMYGEACGELQVLWALAHDVATEAEGLEPHDYEVIGTTYDGVKILQPISEPTNFTREEIRDAVKAALADQEPGTGRERA